jgi:membrane-associated phospholipid phosphatase
MALRASEWIVVAYFAYLAGAAALLPRMHQRSRRRVIGVATLVVIAVVAIAARGTAAAVWRDWLPLIYMVTGYWLPALLVGGMNLDFESKLLTLDHRWRVTTFAARAPRPVIAALEIAYLCCYPMVPAGLAWLYFAGFHDEAERFWIAVLVAVFGCYGLLPWLPTRPPRAIDGSRATAPGIVRTVNLRVLGLTSNQLNTFPSGHAAAALATALAVGARLPLAGVAFGLLALAICIGSVVGRYHYAADALAGAALALLGFLISRLA